MGSLSQFEEYADPLLRGHLSAGNSVGGIGFLKTVEDTDYFLHNLILLWLSVDQTVEKNGGDDGARTRDLRRDRPAF